MGDQIAMTTWPNHENIFYEIMSEGMIFSVMTSRNAVIGLSRKINRNCDYWIVLSNNQYSCIKKRNEHRTKVATPNILSDETYNTFWIAWYGDAIKLGRRGENTPLIMCSNKVPGLRFITFDIRTRRETTPVHWRFELPPIIRRPKLKRITSGQPVWTPIDASFQIPDGAFIAGYENEPVYIMRAPHMNSTTPGKFIPSANRGYLSWGGSSNAKTHFEVLCGYNLAWVPCHEDRIPVNALIGGHSEEESREKLYIGRASHEGHIIPGKVQPSHKVCYIPYTSKEIPKSHYEILVVPHDNEHFVNRYFSYNIEYETGSETDNDE